MDRKATYFPDPTALSLRDLIGELWRARLVVGCVIAVFTASGITWGLVADKQYEASTVVSPVLEENSTSRLGGLGALAAQYGGLAAMAGITLPGAGKKEEAVAVLQSELLTTNYIRDNNLLPVLFWKDWNPATHRWTTTDPEKMPTLWKANQFFKKHVRKIAEDRKSGLVTLTIQWKDPHVAAQWANGLVKMTNDYLRAKAIREAELNIDYLNEQAKKTTIVEAQRAIYSLMQNELNTEMIARGREEYALKVIDPAFAPEKASSFGPRRLGAFGFALGAFLAILGVLGMKALRGT